MIITTAADLAEANDLEYAEATGLLKALIKAGIATQAGTRKNPNGKGKSSNLYQVPLTFTMTLKEPRERSV